MSQVTVFPTKDNESLCTYGTLTEVSDISSLVNLVSSMSWSAGIFKGNYRNNANFLGADFIALDVDGGCTLAEAIQKLKDYSYLIYTSRNHLKEKKGKVNDRFRIVFPLDRPILTAQEYKATWLTLFKEFPFIDEAAKDPARFFFPGTFQSLKMDGKPVSVVTTFSRRTAKFLSEGAPEGTWNKELYIAAKDIQEQLYTQEQAEALLTRPTLLPGNSGALDEMDLQTIGSAFKSLPGNPPRKAIMTVNEKGKERLDMDQLSRDILASDFIYQVDNEMSFIYRIEDHAKRELRLCPNEDVIKRHITKELNQLKKSGAVNLTKPGKFGGEYSAEEILKHWKLNTNALDNPPAPFGWPEEENWVVKRLEFMPVKGEHKAWDEFLNRLSDKTAFMAWAWSCFEIRNKARQAIWLYGPEGQDGKSTVLNVLSNCFGQAAAGLNNTQIRSDNRFVLANFYNKRLIIYPDAKNTKFPMSELFRSLTSGDIVPVEFKGEGTINTRLYVKLAIASNNEPEVTLGKADLSRLIRIDVEPSTQKDDPQWEDRLVKELPEFLGSCKEAYELVCPHHGQIRVNEKTLELTAHSAREMQEPLQEVLEKYFEVVAGAELLARDLRTQLKRESYTEEQIRQFKKFLYDGYKIQQIRRVTEEGRISVYLGIRLRVKRDGSKGFTVLTSQRKLD